MSLAKVTVVKNLVKIRRYKQCSGVAAAYGGNISFDISFVIYINSTNIPPIVIINRIQETQNLLSL